MSITPVHRPLVIVSDPPVPPESLAAAWIARRFGLPTATAGLVRELAEFGPQGGHDNG